MRYFPTLVIVCQSPSPNLRGAVSSVNLTSLVVCRREASCAASAFRYSSTNPLRQVRSQSPETREPDPAPDAGRPTPEPVINIAKMRIPIMPDTFCMPSPPLSRRQNLSVTAVNTPARGGLCLAVVFVRCLYYAANWVSIPLEVYGLASAVNFQ